MYSLSLSVSLSLSLSLSLRIIHENGFTRDECKQYSPVVKNHFSLLYRVVNLKYMYIVWFLAVFSCVAIRW